MKKISTILFFIFLNSICFANIKITGGTITGGKFGKFNPEVFQGFKSFLNAKVFSSLTFDGNNISEWRDVGENGFIASQGAPSKQPLYEPTGLNGRPTLFFDEDVLLFNINTGDSSSHTVFIVHKTGGVIEHNNYLMDSSGWDSVVHDNDYRLMVEAGGDSWFAGSHRGGPTTSINTVYLSNWILNGDTNTGQIFQNGIDLTDANDWYGNRKFAYYTGIGAAYTGVLYFYLGRISAILNFNRILSVSENNQTSNYFNNEWGL